MLASFRLELAIRIHVEELPEGPLIGNLGRTARACCTGPNCG